MRLLGTELTDGIDVILALYSSIDEAAFTDIQVELSRLIVEIRTRWAKS